VADNTTLNAAAGGDVIATDDIGGVKFQRVKLIHGADGVNAGDVAATNPLPILVTTTADAAVKPGDAANNAIRVNVVAGGAGGTSLADEAAFTEGSTSFTPVGGVLNDTIVSDPSEDQAAAFRITAKRALHTNLRDVSGNELASATAAPAGTERGLIVRNIPNGTQTISGTVTANAGTGTFTVDSELPAASALADATANPTAPAVGTFLHAFDGTDWERLRCDPTTRRLEVEVENTPTVTANAGTGTFTTQDTASKVDDAAFTPATDRVVMVGAEFDDTTPDSVDEGDAGAMRMSARRELYIQVRDAAGNERGAAVTAANALKIDGSAVTQPVSGTVTANAGTGTFTVDSELPAAAALADATANPTVPGVGTFLHGFDGTDWERLRCDPTTRRLEVEVENTPTVTANAGTGTFSVQIGAETANRVEVMGDVAHDAAAAGNPVLIGGRANQTEPAAVADADAVYSWMDQQGRTVVVLNFPANVAADDTHGPKSVTITATTNTQLLAAPGAGQSIYVTRAKASNTSATKTICNLVEGGTAGGTDGTIRDSASLAADGGGYVDRFDPPWKLAANTALFGRLGTSVTDVRVNLMYFVAP
jgi:hypothetical protein